MGKVNFDLPDIFINTTRPRRIALVTCSKQKEVFYTQAEYMYTSPLFKKLKFIAKALSAWHILSAKHGLLDPITKIYPYNLKLEDYMLPDWKIKVIDSLITLYSPFDTHFLILASEPYLIISQPLQDLGYQVETPLKGLGSGERLLWANTIVGKLLREHLTTSTIIKNFFERADRNKEE